jgi:hypothetical protein
LVAAFSEKCFKLSDVSSKDWNLLMFPKNVLVLPVFVPINRITYECAWCKWDGAFLV